MPEYITRLSNEKLEQEIAGVYWEAFKVHPEMRVRESGGSTIGLLWAEFDNRVVEGDIVVE